MCCEEIRLYTLKASTAQSCDQFFDLVQGLSSKTSIALRASVEVFLEITSTSVLCSRLYSTVAKSVKRELDANIQVWDYEQQIRWIPVGESLTFMLQMILNLSL